MNSGALSFDRTTLLALVEASRAIISKPQLSDVLKHVTEQATTVLNAEAASVLLYDDERIQLVFHAATGPKGDELIGERFDASLGIAGQALRTGRAVQVLDVKQNRNFFDGVDAKTHMQTHCLVAVPLIHLDDVVGVVEVINPRGRDRFSQTEIELAQIFANLAAAALRTGQVLDRISKDNRGLREAIPTPQIVGHSQAIKNVLGLCQRVAPGKTTVLITGETGTGKELVARAIHDHSDRRAKPFIAVNCAALSETLLESELFGHEKGAFTGAVHRKLGRFELADGGTLFLDEIGEISPATQVKMLRVLQERNFVRVGGTQTIVCDVRIVTATNRDLKEELACGRFRQDLYYRINVFPIVLPPLRQRLEDLPLLIEHFIAEVAPSLGVPPPRIAPAALDAMMRYNWPGNIRELRNIVERCTLLASGNEVGLANLPTEIASSLSAATLSDGTSGLKFSKLHSQEKALIITALTQAKWNQSAAARSLGISRDHLRYRIKKYGLTKRTTN